MGRVKKLAPVEEKKPVRLKKDGTPWRPWSEEVKERMEKRRAKQEAGIPARNEKRPCKAHTTGVHGPRRPCGNIAIPGLEVCWQHGGSTKAAQAAAKKRLVEELDPTISRMIEIRDQSEHLPSALGASTHLLNRILGKPDAVDKDKAAGKPIINVGIAIAGIPAATVQVKALPSADVDDEWEVIEAEKIDTEDHGA